ncbi:MAG: class I SAM-dependent methyltransferase [Alphaproteobacteria bacterium]
MLLGHLLKRMIRKGSLTVVDADGKVHAFGPAGGTPAVMFRLHDRTLHYKLFFNPYLHLGEAYMDGTLTIEQGTLQDLMALFGANLEILEPTRVERALRHLARFTRPLMQYNPMGRAKKHVAHHYDLSDTLYDLFLDRDRQYSCAYFPSPNLTLEQAQEAKKRHLAAKLALEPGCSVLDIGSGWGGLGLYLAELTGGEVTGVTLSEAQHKVSVARAKQAGLEDRVRFHLMDYREITGRFDRIVSVGMFEHVGVMYYGEFFDKVRELLADDGVALLHSIGRSDEPGTTNPWIRKYIFPGGYVPALSEVLPAVERSGLLTTDIEILRLHYAETLKEWQRRFTVNRDRIKTLYDERFCRMWEFYLAGCEMAFRHWDQMVFQLQLTKRLDALPLTRDYIYEWEHSQATETAVA